MTDTRITDAIQLIKTIEPILKGYHPAAQGAALAKLLSIWLKGHPVEARELMLDMHIAQVAKMVEGETDDNAAL